MATFGSKHERSNSWYSLGTNNYVKCSFPNCEHVAEVITKAHCKVAHSMTREEIHKQYGMPIVISVDMQKRFENLKEGFR